MLAYAPRSHRETPHPKTLILIVAGHLFAVGAIMSARFDLPEKFRPTATKIFNVPLIKDPPPPARSQSTPDPHPALETVAPIVDTKPMPTIGELLPPGTPLGPIDGVARIDPPHLSIIVPPPPQITRTRPRLATAEDQLRPPYPSSKRDLGEEATLLLRLTIDERGRVIAVDPVGRAEPAFLASARAHIIRAWRFEPATEDGKPVPSTTIISLTFELGDA